MCIVETVWGQLYHCVSNGADTEEFHTTYKLQVVEDFLLQLLAFALLANYQ